MKNTKSSPSTATEEAVEQGQTVDGHGDRRFSRRELLEAAAVVSAASLAPALSGCSSDDGDGGGPTEPPLGPETLFQHGVASGDPLTDRVILWTRVTPAGTAPVKVSWEIATDPAFAQIAQKGEFDTNADRDFTVKVDASGLQPGRAYYYRFKALGRTSPVGRTRTAPSGAVARLRFAVCSCASYAHGYFHAYRGIARRADLDAVLHLGDYIYEYGTAQYGEVREYEPSNEILTLADYRMRHSLYKREPDLQEAHRQHPFIAIWDDHETADNSWRDGANNHTPADEGSWAERKAAALKAYFEWMPIRETADMRVHRKLGYGDLVDFVMLDTRLWGRTEADPALVGAVPAPDPNRTLLGDDQAQWMEQELGASTARWKLIGQQVMVGNLIFDDTQVVNLDQWHGYPESRQRLLTYFRDSGVKDIVVLTGDIHSSWANELVVNPNDAAAYDPTTGRGSLAVEFVTPGISSPGIPAAFVPLIEEKRPINQHIRYVEPSLRGYIVLDVTPERVQSAWFHYAKVEESAPDSELPAEVWSVKSGETRLNKDAEAAAPPADAPAPAP